MTIASNLYASKAFAEHPIVSWPLDDDVSYISLIQEDDRSFDTWTLSNSTYVDLVPYPYNEYPNGPFPYNTFSELIVTNSTNMAQAISSNILNLQSLNHDMNTLSINMYLRTDDTPEYFEYGYRYLDPFTSDWIEDTKRITDSQYSQWVRIGGTFNPPNVNAQIQLIFRVKFYGGTNPSVIMNGLSVGQWSEATNAKTLGVIPGLLPEDLQLLVGETTLGTKVQAYGISENDGYFLTENNRLLAVNRGIPMVFGSDNITRLSASQTLPAVVLPSVGMLNKSGQFNSYTLEAWMRIENNSSESRRIWGPINSDYGLYVKRGYLSLVIGNSIGSYFIADWYRPMLVHVVVRNGAAAVLINGEQVISIDVDTASLTLPEINEDWMGFYCHNDMPIFEIDCVSVFPYIVPETVAKRRFVWGQGVESPETINSAYEGTVAYIDYPFSEYTSNFAYPDRGNWEAGYFENLVATRRSISVPDYALPERRLGQKTEQELYDDNKVANDLAYPPASVAVISATAANGEIVYQTSGPHPFELSDRVSVTGASISSFNVSANISSLTEDTFTVSGEASGTPTFTNGLAKRDHAKFLTLRPNSTWTDQASLFFPTMNVLTDVVRGIWGVFEVSAGTTSAEPLIHLKNTMTQQVLKIDIADLAVTYKLYDKNGVAHPVSFTFNVEADQHFTVGFHLPLLFDRWGTVIGEFFGNPAVIEIYVGGNGTKTFSGSIYRIGFSNQTNLNEIEKHFYSSGDFMGIAIPDDGALLHDHIGSYVLMPTEEFNRFYLDVGVSSYWEEYYPLSMFAGYVDDGRGNQYYGLDFLQYNIGYPTTTTLVEDVITGSWKYYQLSDEYSSPIVRTYESLDNQLITGWDNYIELSNKEEILVDYDFSQSSVRSYLTFQRISDGANKSLATYDIHQAIPASGVLDVPTYENQMSTKFEIKDHSVIYPPTIIDYRNMAVVVHLEVRVKGIKTNPLNIRKMSLSSRSIPSNGFTPIGTRFGSKLYPYSKNGIYYNYDQKNPYAIYKESTPYLYLTKHSGIESLGARDFDSERGISMPINEAQTPNEEISAIQLWVKYSDDAFPQLPTTLFSLDAAKIDIGFQITTDQSGERGRLTAIDLTTRQDYTGLTFYQDGVQVLTPFLEKDKWTVIGINFSQPIGFSNYTGAINMFPSAIFNSVAYYRATSAQQAQSIVYRRWENVDGTPANPLIWDYWRIGQDPAKSGLWDNVLKLAETGVFGVSPETLFKTYTGTNRQVVDDNSFFVILDDGATMFMGAEWSTYTQKPV